MKNEKLEKLKNQRMFTLNGKPVAKNFEIEYKLGRDSFKRLTEKHKQALIRASSTKQSDISIVDITFTSESTVEVQYNTNTLLKREKCLFDKESLEFYSMPIHIEHENRYEDFRGRSCFEFIRKLEEYTNEYSQTHLFTI